MAALGLDCFGGKAKSAVPALLKLLVNPTPGFLYFGSHAVKRIDPVAAANAGEK